MGPTIRSDLFHGTLYGLAASFTLWTLVLRPPSYSPWAFVLLGLAAATALHLPPSGRTRRVSSIYVFVLAAFLLDGAGASVLAGLTAVAGFQLARIAEAQPGRRRRAAVQSSAVALGASAAGLTGALLPELSTPRLVVAGVVVHALTYITIVDLVDRIARRLSQRRGRRASWKQIAKTAPLLALASFGGAGLAWIFARPDWLLGSIAVACLISGYAAHASREDRRRLIHRNDLKTAAICNSVVQALARLLQAKDEGTQHHVRRVQQLCLDVGSRLGLSTLEMEALSASALLHDIGKIAVPEGILTKPGRLTSSEMARMRVHPDVGADLLESIPFPYPVSPIVRHHHERWDGHGYPSGLSGTAIPLGARILAAVDSYDALTSDRPYRKALQGEDAIAFLQRESGRAFDPAVVTALLEQLESGYVPGHTSIHETPKQNETKEPDGEVESLRGSLPRAQHELRVLYEISRAGEYELSLDEYTTLISCKLGGLVPYRSLVVYFHDPAEKILRARFAIGEGADRLRLMTIPIGERISGWAAHQQRSCIGCEHHEPMERDGSRSDLEEWRDDEILGELRSSLAAPINVDGTNLGVLTLYAGDGRRFTPDERRILVRVAGHLGLAAERARSAEQRGETSLTDPLTGVPNARFLWIESAHRMSTRETPKPPFGLLAFRVAGLEPIGERMGNQETDRLLCQLARRLAAICAESETLVRFGEDLFLVLTPLRHGGELVRRWHDIAAEVEEPPFSAADGALCRIRLTAAHASYPEDGENLEGLLDTLDARLGMAQRAGGSILPFRAQPKLANSGSA